jgi:hypothetical protein
MCGIIHLGCLDRCDAYVEIFPLLLNTFSDLKRNYCLHCAWFEGFHITINELLPMFNTRYNLCDHPLVGQTVNVFWNTETDFSIDLILQAALWPWGRLSL